jgi:hypothetical protein
VRWACTILAIVVPCETALATDVPEDQKAFMEVIERFDRAYAAADNDMAKGATRRQRAKAICAAVKSPMVRDWIGTVYKLSSNNDGKGVLELTLSNHVWVKTWNNAVSDSGYHTLIDPEDPLFAKAVVLKKSQRVQFSGSFFPNSTDCFREGSMTLGGSMDEPEFLFRFTDISPLP